MALPKVRTLLAICWLVLAPGSSAFSSQGLAQAASIMPQNKEAALASSVAAQREFTKTAASASPTVGTRPNNVVESLHNTVVDYQRNETLQYQHNDSVEYQHPDSSTLSAGDNQVLPVQGANADDFDLGFWADDCVATFNYTIPTGCSPFVLTVSDLDPSWRPAVLAAAQTWRDVGTKLRFIPGNITEDMRSYEVTSNGHSTQKRIARGEVRVVLASQIPSNARPSTGDAGISHNRWMDPAGYMLGVLVVLNDVDVSFSLSGTPGSGQYDLQSVALHELGHSIGLPHNNDPSSVMVDNWIVHFFSRNRRTLSQRDIDDVITLYGPRSPLAPPNTPLLLRPSNNELVDPRHQRFEWQPTPSVTGYYFQLSTSQQFTALIANVAPTITNPDFNFNLTAGTRYYWRVKARNFDTNSPWSEIRTFVAGQTPMQTGTTNPAPTSTSIPIPTATSGPQHPIQLYDDWHYNGGYGYVDQPGNYELGQGLDEAVSSLYLQPGWSVRLYEGHNQTGTSVCLAGSNDDFGGDTFEDGSSLNDRVSSFALYHQSGCPAVAQHPIQLYDDWHYNGGYGYVDQSGNYELGQGLDEAVSSLLLRSGWSVRLYDGHNQTGTSVCLTSSNDDFGVDTFEDGSPLNDRPSSFALYNQSSCPAPPQHPIQLYDDWHYNGGYGYVDQSGNYELGQGLDEAVSSLYLQPGWSVRLYDGHNQTGTSVCLTSSNDDFGGDTFEDGSPLNDRPSSLALYHQSACPTVVQHAVQLYDAWHYEGGYTVVDQAGNYELGQGLDEAVSSLFLQPGWSVRLFDGHNESGTSVCLTSSNDDFGGDTFEDGSSLNDRPSSFSVYQQENCPPFVGAELFDEWYYGDQVAYFLTPGIHYLIGNSDNSMSSIRVRPGWAVRLFEQHDTAGPSTCRNSDDPDFGWDTFDDGTQLNDRVSSIMLYQAENCPNNAPTATATTTAGACNITFTDIPEGHTFYQFVYCLACKEILSGYSDGTFRTNNDVTRAQLAKIVANAAGFSEVVSGQMFQDVDTGSPFYSFVQRLASRGHISGYSCGGPGEPCVNENLPYFRPSANASRGQISKIVSNAAGFDEEVIGQSFEDVSPNSPFYLWIQRLTSRTIMSGYACGGTGEPCQGVNLPYFRPNNNATRGHVSKIVSNTFFPNCQSP